MWTTQPGGKTVLEKLEQKKLISNHSSEGEKREQRGREGKGGVPVTSEGRNNRGNEFAVLAPKLHPMMQTGGLTSFSNEI